MHSSKQVTSRYYLFMAMCSTVHGSVAAHRTYAADQHLFVVTTDQGQTIPVLYSDLKLMHGGQYSFTARPILQARCNHYLPFPMRALYTARRTPQRAKRSPTATPSATRCLLQLELLHWGNTWMSRGVVSIRHVKRPSGSLSNRGGVSRNGRAPTPGTYACAVHCTVHTHARTFVHVITSFAMHAQVSHLEPSRVRLAACVCSVCHCCPRWIHYMRTDVGST